MNQYMLELAKKADIVAQDVTELSPAIETFPGLIMEECATACSDPRCGREETAHDLINQHFGFNNV